MTKKILIVFGLAGVFGGVTVFFVHHLIAFTPYSEVEVATWRQHKTVKEMNWQEEEISFSTYENSIEKVGKQISLSGLFLRSPDSESPTMIVLHGRGSNRIGVLRVADMYYRAGFNVLLYDQRHHGRSEGNYSTYGYYESHDVKAAIAFLEREGISTERLGIAGHSFGAATSIMAGAVEDKIDFVIADSAYADMANAVKDNAWRINRVPPFPIPDIGFAFAGLIANFNPWQVSPVNDIKNIGKPVLLLHCDLDEWAYPKYAYQLFEASDKSLTELKMFEDCEHVDAYDDYPMAYEMVVEKFLSRHRPDLNFSLE